jgi:LPXTG-site transpeptidase (sortase) family protein
MLASPALDRWTSPRDSQTSLGTNLDPGDLGNAVIAGHRGRPHLIPIVFDNLYKVRKGDLVNVRESDGRIISFVVRSTHIYGANESAPEVFGDTSGSHLNLITCIWNNAKRVFDKRLVVFTDRQS